MTLFDRYVVIDWSASARPKTGVDSIWIATLAQTGDVDLTNPATRFAAAATLDRIVAERGRDRVLIGVDASLGYPSGTASYFGLDGLPWRSMWAAISSRSIDDDGNRNNRFDVAADLNRRAGAGEGPFWGCPTDRLAPDLRRTKPAGFAVAEFRIVEDRLRSMGRYPTSGWQLLGAGSVGGQTLTLLPILDDRLDRVDVWPFTTGIGLPSAASPVVVAEIWPSWFIRHVEVGCVRDAAQVAGTVEALRSADESGELAAWFAPDVSARGPIEREEGWILGVV